MTPPERVYSVLLVSAAQNLNAALGELLQPSVFSPVRTVTDVSAAKRAAAERDWDIVIVNSPLPDETGLRFAADVSGGSRSVALVLARAELFDEVSSDLTRHGVFTLARPTSKPLMQAALGWLITARERLRGTEKKTLSLEEKMAEIRIVNRAKWLLIEKRGMDEPTAHRYIEKLAMDRCVSKREIAEEILQNET
jgi:response regulator NasT